LRNTKTTTRTEQQEQREKKPHLWSVWEHEEDAREGRSNSSKLMQLQFRRIHIVETLESKLRFKLVAIPLLFFSVQIGEGRCDALNTSACSASRNCQ
jgi:hypothetical protein